MKKKALSPIEIIGIVFLLVLAIGASWYLFFLKPLQAEIASIKNQTEDVKAQAQVEAAKLSKMDAQQAEIDAIFRENENPSEIAAYDNVQNVMNQLNGILQSAKEYSLTFANPTTDDAGIVRRSVSVTVKASTYDDAKAIIMACEQNHWRCLITNMNLASANTLQDVNGGEVSLTATIVFFESKNLKAADSANSSSQAAS